MLIRFHSFPAISKLSIHRLENSIRCSATAATVQANTNRQLTHFISRMRVDTRRCMCKYQSINVKISTSIVSGCGLPVRRHCSVKAPPADIGPDTCHEFFHSTCSQATRDAVCTSFQVVPQFVSAEEEDDLMQEVEPHFRRQKYEFDHWDDVSALRVVFSTRSENIFQILTKRI